MRGLGAGNETMFVPASKASNAKLWRQNISVQISKNVIFIIARVLYDINNHTHPYGYN